MLLKDGSRVAAGFSNQSLATAKTTGYIDITGAREISVIVSTPAVKNDAPISVQFKSASDSSGTGAANVGDPVVVLQETDGDNYAVIASKYIEGLAEGHNYMAASIVEVGSPTVLTSMDAMLVLTQNRYSP